MGREQNPKFLAPIYAFLCLIGYPHRFRVLVVMTRCAGRLRSILSLAAQHAARNPHRSLFYAAHLDDYLAETDAIIRPCFQNHHAKPVALIPESQHASVVSASTS